MLFTFPVYRLFSLSFFVCLSVTSSFPSHLLYRSLLISFRSVSETEGNCCCLVPDKVIY
ncbi:hypothetical protein BDV23DRAFT_149073, partial [Aspergillus alliaceus]